MYRTVMAISGKDFVIVGGDTRVSDGSYGIHTRNGTKICQLADSCVIASSGQQSERLALWKVRLSLLYLHSIKLI